MNQEQSTEAVINVYSDESRHLKGQAGAMVVGGIWCESHATRLLTDKVNLLKRHHGIAISREIKWTKVSPAKLQYYKDIVELFFMDDDLRFRAIVVPTKNLRHDDFGQTEDEFYYKMQYTMLTNIVRKRPGVFRIFLDYKDTWSNYRATKLSEFLERKIDFSDREFHAQPIRSLESVPMQLADLLLGAVAYANNEQNPGGSKAELVSIIESLVGQRLDEQSPFGVDKFNIFKWQPRD